MIPITRCWWVGGCVALLLLSCGFPAMAQAPQVAGIAHVAFRVRDLDSSRSFFQKLGFKEAFVLRDGQRVTEVFVKVNDRQFIELYPMSLSSQTAGQTPGWMHVCYESESLSALNVLYAARGLKPSPVVKAGAGNLLFSLRDPEGKIVEFTQYLPGSLHFKDRGLHLGAQRVSAELQGIRVTPSNLSAAKQFYIQGLGFREHDGKNAIRLRLSGATNQQIDLMTWSAGEPQFLLRVSNIKKTVKELESRGFAVTRQENFAQISDPDGNIFLLSARALALSALVVTRIPLSSRTYPRQTMREVAFLVSAHLPPFSTKESKSDSSFAPRPFEKWIGRLCSFITAIDCTRRRHRSAGIRSGFVAGLRRQRALGPRPERLEVRSGLAGP